MSQLVISGGRIWHRSDPSWPTQDVVVDDGVIVEVRPSRKTRKADQETLDASGMLIVPGLINAHTHAHNNLLKGTGDCRWLESHVNAMAAAFGSWTPRDSYLSTMVGIIEMLKTGTTSAYDMVRAPTEDHLAAVVQAYSESGMRVVVAPTVADQSFVASIPGLARRLPNDVLAEIERTYRSSNTQVSLDFAAKAIESWNGSASGRVRIAVGPLNPIVCSDTLLEGCAELALQTEVGLHTHLLESKQNALGGVSRGGTMSWVQHLTDLGIVNERATFAHGVWLTQSEVALLSERDSTLVHNPASNLKLGSGVAPVRDYLDSGVNVALGTDGSATGDSLDMFGAMWLAALVSHVRTPDFRRWLAAPDVLTMATRNGARSLGLDREIGIVAPGHKADLTFIDLESVRLRPLNDPVTQLVYGDAGTAVQRVLVDGEVVVEDGRLVRVDERAILAEVDETAKRLGTMRPLSGLASRLQSELAMLQLELDATPFPIDRFARGQASTHRPAESTG